MFEPLKFDCICLVVLGWLPVLHNWLKSKDMALCLHAARALANMDRDPVLCGSVSALYEDGIYIAHPLYQQTYVTVIEL